MSFKIGLQLYTVREALEKDPAAALQKVAAAGYEYVELSSRLGLSASALRELLQEAGLKPLAAHISLLDLDTLEEELDYYSEAGFSTIVGGLDFFPYGVPGKLLRRCDDYNRAGALCRERGMTFCYHNHFQEFQRLCGIPMAEWMLENTDPELVTFELDAYWAARAGADPAAFMRKYLNRMQFLHLKDYPEDAPQPLNIFDGILSAYQQLSVEMLEKVQDRRCFTEIGSGVLPVQELLALAARSERLEAVIVDQDYSSLDSFDSIRRSLAVLKATK